MDQERINNVATTQLALLNNDPGPDNRVRQLGAPRKEALQEDEWAVQVMENGGSQRGGTEEGDGNGALQGK
eukprot:1159918-Pelagomonas_calceolata.AAC.2